LYISITEQIDGGCWVELSSISVKYTSILRKVMYIAMCLGIDGGFIKEKSYIPPLFNLIQSWPLMLSLFSFLFRLLRTHWLRSLQLILFVSSSSTLIALSSIQSIALGYCLCFSITTVCFVAATTVFVVLLFFVLLSPLLPSTTATVAGWCNF